MLGREVLTQVNQKKNAGIHEVKFDAADLPSDVYLYSLVAGHFVQTRKMIVIKQGFPIPEDPRAGIRSPMGASSAVSG